jgi:hypothetical protein
MSMPEVVEPDRGEADLFLEAPEVALRHVVAVERLPVRLAKDQVEILGRVAVEHRARLPLVKTQLLQDGHDRNRKTNRPLTE